MRSSIEKVAKDIRTLKIQGARNVAKAAVEAIVDSAEISKAKNKKELYKDLLKDAKILEKTRPTEPMMRNALDDTLRFTLAWIQTNKNQDIKSLKLDLGKHYKTFLQQMQNDSQKIAEYAANEIQSGSNILIHCHSSTLINSLKKAHDLKKNIHVICLETRPLYQGRLSARELSEYGIETTLAIDSSVGSQMHKTDLVLTGADAITAEGDLVNKIGTFTIAQLAHLHAVPFMCTVELFKYDPLTRFGAAEPIEQRNPLEVWGTGLYAKEIQSDTINPPKKLQIQNPAFDKTPAAFISAYITGEGLIPPAQLSIIARAKLNGENYGKINI